MVGPEYRPPEWIWRYRPPWWDRGYRRPGLGKGTGGHRQTDRQIDR